jgi:hypothetical protein
LNNSLFATFDLAGDPAMPIFAAELEFCHWGDFGPGAAGYVEVSDNGGLTWNNMYEVPHSFPAIISSWDWETVTVNLDPFVGGEIILRFRFVGPGCGCNCGTPPETAEGWYVDNIILRVKYHVYEDETPPITSICLTGNTVTMFAYDPVNPPEPVSGVCDTFYSTNGMAGPFVPYVGPFTIGEGTTEVCFYSVDCAGNEETIKCETFVIDTTPPTIEITKPVDNGLYLFDNFIMNRILGSGTLCIGKITIEADANDAGGSGVNIVTFEIDGDTGFDMTAPYQYTYSKFCFMKTLTVTATAIDNAGNSASDSTTFQKLF